MEHSLRAYLLRQTTEVLELLLKSCLCGVNAYATPLIQEILEQRKQEKAASCDSGIDTY